MPKILDRDKIKKHLENFDLRSLFIEELGWDHGGTTTEVTVTGRTFVLQAVAQKRGMVVYQYVAESDDAFPDHPVRQKIEKGRRQDRPRTPHRLRLPRQEHPVLAVGEARAGPA